MKFLKRFAIVVFIIFIIYTLGPNPSTPKYKTELPTVPSNLIELENFVNQQEKSLPVKPNNEARIVWADDSIKTKTDYCLLYLHGFSASQEEGNPTHRETAKKLKANLYLARLSKHGLSEKEELANLTAENYWESALQALAIAKQLGNKVIIMGTSTGGTQALQLAANNKKDIAALILMSPNIAINDPNAWLLNNPWGLQIAHLVKGSNYNEISNCSIPVYKQYWNCKYRLEAAVQLQEMLETTMLLQTFNKITCPVLCLAYYKNDKEQDPVVKVSAMEKMVDELGSTKKKLVKMPNVGDHVMGSPILSKDIAGVQKEIDSFLQEILADVYKKQTP